MNLIHNIVA